MEPAAVLFFAKMIIDLGSTAIEVKKIMDRLKNGETITLEELQAGEAAQLAANDELQGLD